MDKPDSRPANGSSQFGPTSRSLPIALLRTRERIMVPIREMLQQSGISEQQWRVLRVVDEAGEMEQTAIAQAACLQLPSLTRILRSMESDGLVGRKTDEADRRRTLVSVTAAGKTLIARHRQRNAQIFATVEAEFGREKLDLLLDLLDELQQIRM
ncbi:homoprotocatechuate degradation operon regulator HpaR [Hoeflea alexandrii]|uniref:Homoprotocatechuate degradation operon regulator HpaR n=1 Tax=Hoeflea alexandrii TaxID=288436 RepID=A0ABT1CXY3_9HYPH|nr:homoprotocatechuate degradation operon regulator HpaR [Hoeflea alexandrii]MCO6411054.1 homoprotocatechuate degradation operon regulator HpaR [Hoeflea alexandrii]|tara:strand:- start:511 stop:975 length:465 start_codon:yes stop_codon:yes gene_type:complete